MKVQERRSREAPTLLLLINSVVFSADQHCWWGWWLWADPFCVGEKKWFWFCGRLNQNMFPYKTDGGVMSKIAVKSAWFPAKNWTDKNFALVISCKTGHCSTLWPKPYTLYHQKYRDHICCGRYRQCLWRNFMSCGEILDWRNGFVEMWRFILF